ncbi:MAG: AraC family transcriptional regulator ligand-binding domain-containing protein [Gammaproteobacteria bacterium]|nr:AraC family transcriptional regulator ligand-binding domain-containing protein [Gammaproteobacteria bacterium]MBI5619284.1 AraC family transcriptional regulator ligand-binding domain-containing protein [Gammaproteobacteria bacterium]
MSTKATRRPRPTIPVAYPRLIARQLGLQEKDLGLLTAGTELEGTVLLDERTLLTRDQLLQTVRNAVRLSRNAAFGLRLGQALTPPTHGQLGFVANTSPTLGTAITAYRRFLPGRVSFTHLRLEHRAATIVCHLDVDFGHDVDVYPTIIEAFALSLLSLVTHVLGRPLKEGLLRLDYAAPAYVRKYRRYVACPVEFAAGECALHVPAVLLDTPNVTADHVSHRIAMHQCEILVRELDEPADAVSRKVKQMLLSHPGGQLSETRVAAALFISKRTLARRLALEGKGYRQLRDEVLSSLAAGYLRDTKLSVDAIAGLLAYHDSANFRRAFKRWFERTPETFRREERRLS